MTGGHTAALSPDAVKTAIDAVMYEEFTREMQPAYLAATDPFFFKQDTTEKYVFIWDEDSGVGEFDETGEQQEIVNTDTFIGNQKSKVSQKYTKQIPISDEAFRADEVGKRARIGKQIAERARTTRDKKAILNTFGDAFAGAVNTTPDGLPLASNSHLSLKGQTIDNLETGAMNPDNMWIGVQSLANQKAQDGDFGGHVFEGLVSPFLLYKTAKEVMNSELLPNGAENNINIFDTDFGEVQIKAPVQLNTQYNSASNAATSFHLLGRNHQITRKVFYDIVTSMRTPEQSDNDSYSMRSKFHESTFPGTWTAYVGHNGTTA